MAEPSIWRVGRGVDDRLVADELSRRAGEGFVMTDAALEGLRMLTFGVLLDAFGARVREHVANAQRPPTGDPTELSRRNAAGRVVGLLRDLAVERGATEVEPGANEPIGYDEARRRVHQHEAQVRQDAMPADGPDNGRNAPGE